ncbi:MAG: hypothetical protein ACC682_13035 [Gemmatimonadota bacterium]
MTNAAATFRKRLRVAAFVGGTLALLVGSPLDAQSIVGDAWMAGGAVFRIRPSEKEQITPWVEWRGTVRNERFAVNGTLSFSDRAYVRDVILAGSTPVTQSTELASDLAVGFHLRADVQLIGRGTVISGAATGPLVPEEDGTLMGLFARAEGALQLMPDDNEFWDYRLGLGFLVANSRHSGSITAWAGEAGRLDKKFDVSAPPRFGISLEYISPQVWWPRLLLRVDGSTARNDRADVVDHPGVVGDLVDELEVTVGLVVPLIPRGF